MTIKLVTTTWNHSDTTDSVNHILLQSFKKLNPNIEIINTHFNRGRYHRLEKAYQELYGSQYEFLLYRVELLYHKIKEINTDFLILCDTSDCTCVSPIDGLVDLFDLENNVIIGSETNQWPMPMVKQNWTDYTDYNQTHHDNKTYLNAGGILASKNKFLELLDIGREVLLNKQYVFGQSYENDRRYGGLGSDQGLFTWIYNMVPDSPIKLDIESKFLINSYGRSIEDYYIENNKLYSKSTGNSTYFVHDNGWNHGSPKFHDNLELNKLYLN
jgi:hypothetical protein